jgi:hypothetical protein
MTVGVPVIPAKAGGRNPEIVRMTNPDGLPLVLVCKTDLKKTPIYIKLSVYLVFTTSPMNPNRMITIIMVLILVASIAGLGLVYLRKESSRKIPDPFPPLRFQIGKRPVPQDENLPKGRASRSPAALSEKGDDPSPRGPVPAETNAVATDSAVTKTAALDLDRSKKSGKAADAPSASSGNRDEAMDSGPVAGTSEFPVDREGEPVVAHSSGNALPGTGTEQKTDTASDSGTVDAPEIMIPEVQVPNGNFQYSQTIDPGIIVGLRGTRNDRADFYRIQARTFFMKILLEPVSEPGGPAFSVSVYDENHDLIRAETTEPGGARLYSVPPSRDFYIRIGLEKGPVGEPGYRARVSFQ